MHAFNSNSRSRNDLSLIEEEEEKMRAFQKNKEANFQGRKKQKIGRYNIVNILL
jgi:hypothetical protein